MYIYIGKKIDQFRSAYDGVGKKWKRKYIEENVGPFSLVRLRKYDRRWQDIANVPRHHDNLLYGTIFDKKKTNSIIRHPYRSCKIVVKTAASKYSGRHFSGYRTTYENVFGNDDTRNGNGRRR